MNEQAHRAEAPIVIGVAGGVGSGKSTVARMLGDRGFIVWDFDAMAKALLDRPDVLAQIVEWWGDDVQTTDAETGDARANRAAIAGIIFSDDDARHRLESLIHPLVMRSHDDAAAAAEAAGAPGVVFDAPLLFEAGLDASCDFVVFVEVPRAVRESRVTSRRGWDATELDRRESAQRPLPEKRAASRYVITNDGDESGLRSQVDRLCATIGATSGYDVA
ncbi:MAG: dephospho-CoA kinase [Phycisphaerales bacterium]